MQREWCPAQAADGGNTNHHKDSSADCAWQRSVAAANSDISAFRHAENVPRKVLAVPRFSAAVVASKTNKGYIPVEEVAEANFRIAGASFPGVNVSMSSTFLGATDSQKAVIDTVAVPATQAEPLLSHFAKHTRSDAPRPRDILLLSSLAGTVTVEDVLTAVGYSHTLGETLTAMSLSGGTNQKPPGLPRFVKDATSLRCLGLPNCHLSPHVSELCAALGASSSIEHVSLAGNDAGADGEFAEENANAIADLLKHNKFLLSLDLSNNGFSTSAVHDMMMALAGSDTKLLPADLPPKPEVETIPVDELVDAESILGSGEDEEDALSANEEEEEESEDDNTHGAGQGGTRRRYDDDGDGEEAEEDDDEEAEDADEAIDGDASAPAGDDADDDDDEEREERARLRYEQRVARVARQVAREEARMRRTLLRHYVRETKETVASLYYDDIVALRAKEEEARVEAFCKRRSGWSHLEWLSLAGNSVGDRGALGVAACLLNEVKLDEEQIHETEEELRESAQKLLETLLAARYQTLVSESKERASLTETFKPLLEAAERRAMYGNDDADDDDYAAPDVVMTNIDDEGNSDGDGDGGVAGGAHGNTEDGANDDPIVDDEGIESDLTQWTLPVSSTKRGMNALRHLDLSGCAIGNRGLKHLAKSLLTNHSVETLLLRSNKFGKATKSDAASVPSTTLDSSTAPSGVVALAQTLCSNEVLRCLDLSYCHLEPSSLRLLSEALRENQMLHTLRLEGTNLGLCDTAAATASDSSSCLLELLEAVCVGGVRHLSVSHNNLEPSLWQEEIEALAVASRKLESLELSNTGLTGAHIAKWLDALGDDTCRLERLHVARNTFAGTTDGQVLHALLLHCPQLSDLCLDDNIGLGSDGLAAMLGDDGHEALPPLRRLRCCHIGLTTPFRAAGNPVLAPSVLERVTHLDLGDVNIRSTDLLESWMKLCQQHCRHLEYISFWAREVGMEGHLSFARELVESLPSLLYADFGVLLRFDSQRDLEDDLGCVEKELVKRRTERHQSTVQP